jgi:hypothetical protein
MGLNPFDGHRNRLTDVLVVVGAVAVTVALVAWAAFG